MVHGAWGTYKVPVPPMARVIRYIIGNRYNTPMPLLVCASDRFEVYAVRYLPICVYIIGHLDCSSSLKFVN